MEQPNYILKTFEGNFVPANPGKDKIIKTALLIILGIIIFGSLILDINLFSELSFTAKFLLVSLILTYLVFGRKTVDKPSPLELHFYNDKILVIKPKRYVNGKKYRRLLYTMKYVDITKVLYKTQSQRINIYGNGSSMWFDYIDENNVPSSPTGSRSAEGALIHFTTHFAKDVDFVKEIEEHSPLKVILEDD